MEKIKSQDRKYKVLPYNPAWAIRYEEIRKNLQSVFGDVALRIEHIGSTVVPGMSAKPTIDVLVVVKDVDEVDELNQSMKNFGYDALGEYVGKGGRLFVKEENGERLVNVHCFPEDHSKVEDLIVMRDFLRESEDEAGAYAKFKLDLSEKYLDDYFAYRKEKDVYIQDMRKRMEKWKKDL